MTRATFSLSLGLSFPSCTRRRPAPAHRHCEEWGRKWEPSAWPHSVKAGECARAGSPGLGGPDPQGRGHSWAGSWPLAEPGHVRGTACTTTLQIPTSVRRARSSPPHREQASSRSGPAASGVGDHRVQGCSYLPQRLFSTGPEARNPGSRCLGVGPFWRLRGQSAPVSGDSGLASNSWGPLAVSLTWGASLCLSSCRVLCFQLYWLQAHPMTPS